jgi:hypothetical protein
MPRIRTRRALLLSFALVLAACAEGDAQGGGASPHAPVDASGNASRGNPPATDAASAADRFEATVGTAPFAGTHAVIAPMGCMMLNGLWQAGSEPKRSDGLSAVLVQVQEVPASGGSSENVTLTLGFGRMGDMSGMAGQLYLYGAEMGGDARGTIERNGAGAVIRIEGTAQTGAHVSATLRCATVDFMQ